MQRTRMRSDETEDPPSKADRLILEEASEWFVDFRVGDVDAAARERFDEWLRRSPEHIRAYMEIAKIYVELPAFKIAGKLDVDSLIACAHSGENVVPFGKTDSTRAPKTRGHGYRDPSPGFAGDDVREASATPILGRCGGDRAEHCRCRMVEYRAHPVFATDIGERRSITLADGSTVDLNARSKLRIEFSKNERRVELIGRPGPIPGVEGQDSSLHRDKRHATVRAVGTQFDVYRKDSGTTVTVLEGRVAVYSTPPGGGPAAPPAAKSRPFSDAPSAAAQPQASTTSHSNAKPPIPTGLTDPSQTAAIFLVGRRAGDCDAGRSLADAGARRHRRDHRLDGTSLDLRRLEALRRGTRVQPLQPPPARHRGHTALGLSRQRRVLVH